MPQIVYLRDWKRMAHYFILAIYMFVYMKYFNSVYSLQIAFIYLFIYLLKKAQRRAINRNTNKKIGGGVTIN